MTDFEASLNEIGDITNSLLKEGNIADALTTAMQALNLKKQRYGSASAEFQQERVRVAGIVLEAARLHQSHGKVREAADLLVFVDNFTTENLSLPALDRLRLLLRSSMLKELMIARQGQGRHRSALTFGRHFLAVCKRLLLVYELPTAHLNIASVLSSMKLHEEALSHSYLAYQSVNQILAALSHEEAHPTVANALKMEGLDRQGNADAAFEKYEYCLELVESYGNPTDESSPSLNRPVNFSIDGDQSEQTSLSHLWWAGDHNVAKYPCIQLLVSMQVEHNHSKKAVSTVEDERRWRGILALCFRSIAVEQEHLNQISSALLTYRVALATAKQCLGDHHPIYRQCNAAYEDAVEASKHRNSRVSPAERPNRLVPLSKRAATPLGGNASRSMSGTAVRLNRKSRPLWNPWFNSSEPPPSQALTKDPQLAKKHQSFTQQRSEVNVLPQVEPLSQPTANSYFMARPKLRETLNKRSSTPTKGLRDSPEELDELQPEDYAFLRQTFKLRHDLLPRGTSYGPAKKTTPVSNQKTLKAEKRLATALAAEMGIESNLV